MNLETSAGATSSTASPGREIPVRALTGALGAGFVAGAVFPSLSDVTAWLLLLTGVALVTSLSRHTYRRIAIALAIAGGALVVSDNFAPSSVDLTRADRRAGYAPARVASPDGTHVASLGARAHRLNVSIEHPYAADHNRSCHIAQVPASDGARLAWTSDSRTLLVLGHASERAPWACLSNGEELLLAIDPHEFVMDRGAPPIGARVHGLRDVVVTSVPAGGACGSTRL